MKRSIMKPVIFPKRVKFCPMKSGLPDVGSYSLEMERSSISREQAERESDSQNLYYYSYYSFSQRRRRR